MTRNEIRSDIELRLTKGKPSDDLELDHRQIDFWIDAARDSILSDSIKAGNITSGDAISGSSTMLTGAPIKIQSSTIDNSNSKFINPAYFVEVPNILTLPNDIGISQVFNINGDPVSRIRITDIPTIKYIKTLKPTSCHPVYYRVEDKLYILGPSEDFLKHGYLIVFGILADTSSIPDDERYPMPEDLVAKLIDLAEQIGRRQLQLPTDLTGDGVD